MTLTDKELKKKMNKDAVLESYKLSKRQRKELHLKRKSKKEATINKVKRIDW